MAIAEKPHEGVGEDDRLQSAFEEESRKAPLSRPGLPEEVADAVAFLVRNAFVTGIVMDVDGAVDLKPTRWV